jgi:4-hydroxy-tetrahydrodipicolinate synthase
MAKTGRDKLQGVLVSLPTFLDDEFELRLDRQRKHMRWLLQHGLVGRNAMLMVCGGLGEGYFLNESQWKSLVDVLAEECAGKVTTLAGIFETNAKLAAKKARYAAQAGLDFVQLAPPHYMVPTEQEILNHVRYVNDHAGIDIMFYNTYWSMPNPGQPLTDFIIDGFLELDHVAGMKWSSSDMGQYMRIYRRYADKLNLIDNQVLFNNMQVYSLGARLGARGFIDFFGNVAPRLSLQFLEYFRAKKWDDYDSLWFKVSFDPWLGSSNPADIAWVGMGEGPISKITFKAFGLDAGPAFPTQALPPDAWIRNNEQAIKASGILEWSDWRASVLD